MGREARSNKRRKQAHKLLRVRAPKLKAVIRALLNRLFCRVTVIEIERYDWRWHQSICLRPWPTIKPSWFTHRIRILARPKLEY